MRAVKVANTNMHNAGGEGGAIILRVFNAQ
jgi:hypothetical protein